MALFNLLFLNGESTAELPLIKRKERPQRLFKKAVNSLRYSEHVAADGPPFRAQARNTRAAQKKPRRRSGGGRRRQSQSDGSAPRRDQSRIVLGMWSEPALVPDAATLLVRWGHNRASLAVQMTYVCSGVTAPALLGNRSAGRAVQT